MAAEALAALELPPRDARVLAVQCVNGHHVAAVYTTSQGPVVEAAQGRHSHGHRDRVDTPHRGTPESHGWIDFLGADAVSDDDVPAWCDCGPWTLSRRAMSAWIDAGERRVHLESKA